MNNRDLQIIKDKLAVFETEYNHADWLRLKKELPRNPFYNTTAGKIIIGSIAVISLISAFILLNKNDESSKTKINNISGVLDKAVNKTSVKRNNEVHELSPKNLNIEKIKINSVDQDIIVVKVDKSNIIEEDSNYETVDNTEKTDIIDHSPESSEEKNEETIVNHHEQLKFVNTIVHVDNSCEPVNATFSAFNLPSEYRLVWDTDNFYNPEGNTVNVTYNEAGVFYPSATIYFGNKAVKTVNLDEITVLPKPESLISFVNNNNIYYFSVDNNPDNTSILWTIENDKFFDTDLRHVFNKSGVYEINVQIENKHGCKNFDSRQIEVILDQAYYLPNAFIPFSNNINSYFGPIGENLEFEAYKMIIADQTGKMVFESENPEHKWNGRLNNTGPELKEGIYLWEIITIDIFGNTETKKGRVNLLRK